MGRGNFTEDFKRDAVAQIVERGYRVAEVSQRLRVVERLRNACSACASTLPSPTIFPSCPPYVSPPPLSSGSDQ